MSQALNQNELEKRLRSHTYPPNTVVSEFLYRQRSQTDLNEVITVRERHLSDVSVASSGQSEGADQVDVHDRCITPVPDVPHDLKCVICRNLAINPFRCTTAEERSPVRAQYPSNRIEHICCYQCVARFMQVRGTDCIACPICQVNEFNLRYMIHANEQIISDGHRYVIHCPNDCGLMGNPSALANHICVLQNPQQPGHTPMTNIMANLREAVSNLSQENAKLRVDLADMIRKYDTACKGMEIWRSEYYALQNEFHSEQTRMELTLNINARLRHQIEELNILKVRMEAEKTATIRRCKTNLKFVVKHYKTRVQELNERNDRLYIELKDLISVATSDIAASSADQRRPRAGSSGAESSDDQPLLGFLSLKEFPPLPPAQLLTPTPENSAQQLRDSSSDEETHVSNRF